MRNSHVRRFLSIAICLMMLLPVMAGAALADDWQNPFEDVKEGDWFYDSIKYVVSNELFNGTGATTFSPSGIMTRGMYVTALGRLAYIEIGDYPGAVFDDIDENEYYAPYVNWAAQYDIVQGTGDNKFSPDRTINREEMAVILARFCEYLGIELDGKPVSPAFADEADISSWAKDAVAKMMLVGIVEGIETSEGRMFYPKNSVNRASVATLIMRFSMLLDSYGPLDAARAYLELIIAEAYEKSEELLGSVMSSQLQTMGGTKAYFENYVYLAIGKLLSVDDISLYGVESGYTVYAAFVTTEMGEITALIYLDSDNKIDGLAFLPGAEPPIAMPEGFTETKVTVDAGFGFPLEGYVVKPESSDTLVPAVVLVQGSGASNYDEIAGVNRVFGKLAKGLAEQGIATLRYDKRNYAYPEIMGEKDYSIEDEYIEDVLSAVELLKAQEGIDPNRVYILGHSQGGMLAPLFLDRGADAAGMILLAGTPRNLLDVLDDQQEDLIDYYLENGMEDYAERYRALQEGWRAERSALEAMTAEQAMQAGTVYSFNAYYMYVLNRYDAISTIKELQKPALILQGGNDLQVYADKDYEIYKRELSGASYASFKLYDGLNHMFMPSTAGNIIEAMNEYYIQADIPDAVFEDIADWIGSLS